MTIADSRVVGWLNPDNGMIVSDSTKQLFPEHTYIYTVALVRESLLAEAETERDRLTSCLSQANILIEQFERDWYMACDERDRNAAQRDALQSRLDAVVGLADKYREMADGDVSIGESIVYDEIQDELRSAALGASPRK